MQTITMNKFEVERILQGREEERMKRKDERSKNLKRMRKDFHPLRTHQGYTKGRKNMGKDRFFPLIHS